MRRREWMTAMRMSEFCFPTLVSFHLPPVSLKRPVAPDSVAQRRLKLDSIARCHTGSKKITIGRTAKKPIASVRKPPLYWDDFFKGMLHIVWMYLIFYVTKYHVCHRLDY